VTLRIVLTGATGLIGRNLLFEILKQNYSNLEELSVVVLGRGKNGKTICQRIRQLILEEGVLYLNVKAEHISTIEDFTKTNIECVAADLTQEKLGITDEDYSKLKKEPIDFFFHVAALTDLGNAHNVEQSLKRTNVYGTRRILELIAGLKVKEFCYVGTAYSCRDKCRNPYEGSKLEAEQSVREFSRKHKVRCRYFKPSVTCGRLIEPPLGSINKFDVFYGWVAFFLKLKSKKIIKRQGKKKLLYEDPMKIDMKICYNLKSGLNIVPADFVAKVMYQVCIQNAPGEEYFLVNNEETPHKVYIPLMLKVLNLCGSIQVDKVPNELNPLEKIYYKTVGRIFTPYVISEPISFDTCNLYDVLKRAKLSCPPVNEKNFSLLMEYAKKVNFGFNPEEL